MLSREEDVLADDLDSWFMGYPVPWVETADWVNDGLSCEESSFSETPADGLDQDDD